MKIKIALFSLLMLTLFFIGSSVTLAQTPPPLISGGSTATPPPLISDGQTNSTQSSSPTLQNPLQAQSVTSVLLSLVDLLIFLGGIVAVIMFVFIGFKFVLAQGNESELKKAKEWFMYAAIGTAILISSKVIVEVVKQTFISAGVVDSRLFNNNP